MTALVTQGDGAYRCGHPSCGVRLVKCHNFAVEGVCNRGVMIEGCDPPPANALCDYCGFNRTIPDLNVLGNREKWRRLEVAKRRTLYGLDLLGLPYGDNPRLQFDFKSDPPEAADHYEIDSVGERVYTGHANGVITINLREADPVEREKARVQFNENHRTLVRHLRHELGHYFWQKLIAVDRVESFVTAFGDHRYSDYASAQQGYYANGPWADWQTMYISAYASMHPWEDFAETFGAYLDIVGLLDTHLHFGAGSTDPITASLTMMIDAYQRLGIVGNEINREMGLLDLVTRTISPPVVTKIAYIHDLVRSVSAQAARV